ncbi:MAG: hypothetical protein IAG13_11730 [Deltaproteobacteria bacterium]|nr:hypothetical protein [Nannocystaceae bacterium]
MVMGLAVPIGCGDDSAVMPEESSSSGAGSSSDSIGESGTQPPGSADTSSSGTATSTTEADSSGSDSGGSSSGSSSGSESSGAPESSSSESNASSSSESGPMPLVCPAGELGPELPETLFGNSFGQDDDFTGSCGGAGSPDVGFTFTAPADGSYTFDTHGSQLDSVVYVLDGTCDGTELGCNDDGDGAQSVVVVDLVADQTVTVIVDGNGDAGLPFSLRVQSGALGCPDGDLGSTVPNLVDGDSSSAFNANAGSCGGGGNDVSYLFTAPNSGTFTFDTFGSSFVSRIYVQDGTCGGAEIACGREGVLADLDAGQQVTVVIDAPFGGGEFSLNVDTLGGACPDDDIGNTVPQTISGTTVGGDNTLAGSCGGDFSADDIYEFSAPQDGLYQFDTFGSALDTVLYLRNATCGGEELDCNDDFTPNEDNSRIIAGMTSGQTVLLAVDGNGVGAYDLNVDLVPCPDETIAGALPQNLSDTTEGGINKLQPSCGNTPTSETSDYAYSFTAPAAGLYTFDTVGTFYDTVLYLLDGAACNGDEIACNDDYQFNQSSALAVALAQDQTVTVVVDADFQQEGDFTLHVGALDGACPDEDIGSTVPNSIDGSTVGADNASAGSCGGLTGNDYSYLFTAPEDAFFTFTLSSADFNASIYANTPGCGGEELNCSSSFFGGGALAVANLVAGETVVVTIDGDDEEGDFTMDVDQIGGDGDCCIAHAYTGCGNPEVEDCVCSLDSFCCMSQWDGICVSEATDDCGADC